MSKFTDWFPSSVHPVRSGFYEVKKPVEVWGASVVAGSASTLMAFMLAMAIAVVSWGADRGMGIADEGVYLLAARYPSEIEQNVSAVFDYTGAIFKLVGYDPQRFRLAGLTAIMLSALAFWVGFQKLVRLMFPSGKYVRLNSMLFIQLGAILYYQWAFATPNYYTLTAIALNTFGGFVMWALANETISPGNRLTAALFGLSGFALGAGAFVRFTSGVLVLGCLLALLWYWPGIGRRRQIRLLMLVGVGAVAWSALHFLLVQGPVQQWEMFSQGWSLYQAIGTHSPGAKIVAYPRDLLMLGARALLLFWPCHLLVATALLASRLAREHKVMVFVTQPAVIAALVLAVAAALSWSVGVHVLDSRRADSADVVGVAAYLSIYGGWILVLLSLYGLFALQPANTRMRCEPTSMQCRGLVLFLLVMPVAGSVGTANPLYNVISFYAAPWFGLIFLLGLALTDRYRARPALSFAVLIIVGGVATSQVVQGSIQAPAQIPTTLLQQAVPTEVGFPAHQLKLDGDLHAVVEGLRAAATRNGFQPGDAIVAVSYLPGLVYAIGGRSPGHPAFLLGNAGYFAYSKMALSFARKQDLQKALVLINLAPQDNELRALLASSGLDFPTSYTLIGEVSGNRVTYRLYKPHSGSKPERQP